MPNSVKTLRVRVTYSSSSIGVKQDQKDTIVRLGLRRLWQSVEHDDTPTLRGMLHKVRHLVTVEDIVEDPLQGKDQVAR